MPLSEQTLMLPSVRNKFTVNGDVDHVVEEWTSAKDGTALFSKSWKAMYEPPIATVVFIHGFDEHVNRYNHVFSKFQRANIEVFAYDQRGFGQTAVRNKNRGVTGGLKVIMGDITYALRTRRRERTPQFLFGHSMGGGLSLNYMAEGEEREHLAGFIISSALVLQSDKTKPPQPVISLAYAVSKILPNLPIPVNLPSKYISQIPEEVEKHKKDPLIHGTGTLGGLSAMLTNGKTLLKTKYQNITKPLYMYHGTIDCYTSFDAAKNLFEKIPSADKTFRAWDGGYHELHNDLDQDAVIAACIDWILAHSQK